MRPGMPGTTPGMAAGQLGPPGQPVPGQAGSSAAGTAGASTTPPVVGIDVQAEISRINNNIFMYELGIAAAAIGIGLSTCLFVRSIYKPPKGVHGGDSDEDMESEDDEDDEGSEES